MNPTPRANSSGICRFDYRHEAEQFISETERDFPSMPYGTWFQIKQEAGTPAWLVQYYIGGAE